MFRAVTTYQDGGAPDIKPFSWSYSKLKNYRACPKKHWHLDITKDVAEESSDALEYGNAVHAALAARVSKGTPLPVTMRDYEEDAARVIGTPMPGQILLVEQQMAIKRDLTSSGYFERGVWYRAKCDVVKVWGDVGVAVDWKTGKILEDQEQLALMAQCVFSKYPQVQKIRTQYVWLGSKAVTTLDLARQDMQTLWAKLLPEVNAYEQACTNQIFPPRPGGLCRRYCPVTSCQYHGKGSY